VFVSLLSESRKFGTHWSIAAQFLESVSDNVRAAVLGNVGTLMVFRVSAADAEVLAPEFHPLPPSEFVDQSPFTAKLRRIDADHRTIFLEPPLYPTEGRRAHIVAQSRRNFGRPRDVIEKSFAALPSRKRGRGV